MSDEIEKHNGPKRRTSSEPESQNYKNYLEEAEAFSSYLQGVVANTSRYVPEDQIWPMKSCSSQDSGYSGVVSGPGDGLDNGLDRDYNKQFEDDLEENENLQFAKCREGIRLFREESMRSREPEKSPSSARFVFFCAGISANEQAENGLQSRYLY